MMEEYSPIKYIDQEKRPKSVLLRSRLQQKRDRYRYQPQVIKSRIYHQELSKPFRQPQKKQTEISCSSNNDRYYKGPQDNFNRGYQYSNYDRIDKCYLQKYNKKESKQERYRWNDDKKLQHFGLYNHSKVYDNKYIGQRVNQIENLNNKIKELLGKNNDRTVLREKNCEYNKKEEVINKSLLENPKIQIDQNYFNDIRKQLNKRKQIRRDKSFKKQKKKFEIELKQKHDLKFEREKLYERGIDKQKRIIGLQKIDIRKQYQNIENLQNKIKQIEMEKEMLRKQREQFWERKQEKQKECCYQNNKSRKQSFKIIPIKCQYSPDKNQLIIAKLLEEQIYYDSLLRKAKFNFDYEKNWQEFQRVLDQHNENQIRPQFFITKEQMDQFENEQVSAEQLFKIWDRANKNWVNKVYDQCIEMLKESNTKQLQELVNKHLNTFYKESDLVLISNRLNYE